MKAIYRLLSLVTPRFLRRSLGAQVLTGFGLTAALAGLVAVISLYYNVDAGRDLARVAERDRQISTEFRNLEVAVEQQSGAVQNFLLSVDQRDLDTLRTARERFDTALMRLDEMGLNQNESLAAVRLRQQAFDDVAGENIALAQAGWDRSAEFLWRTDAQEIKSQLLAAVGEQVEQHNGALDREISASRLRLRFAFGLSIGLVLVAAALAFIVGMGITEAVTRPVRNLMRVAAAVGGGDYTVRAPVEGRHELATLTEAMNSMVGSLATSRGQLEQALVETERSEERYRLLTDNANDIIFALDRSNAIVFVNPAVKRTLGYEPAELIGRSVATLFSDSTQELVTQRGGWVVTQPRRFTADIELVAKDGRTVPFEVNSSVMRVDGKAVGVQGIARDMTERHGMEQELRRLHVQDRRRVDQLVTVNQIGRKIAALQPVATLLPQIVQLLGRTFEYHHVRILTLGEEGDLTTAAVWHPGADREHQPEASISPLVERALRGDAGFVAGSGRPEDDAATRYTEVAVPIRTKSAVLGVLDIRGGSESGLDESDIFTLQTLADQIAVAVENARLYETGQRLAVSEERNRLARELHDSVTQELFSMTMIAGALPALVERKPEVAKERMDRLHDLARGALAEMRALLFALRPAALAEEGLIAAVNKYAAAFQSREGVTVHINIDGEGRLPDACEEALYRVAQEALNNVVKHAGACNVWIDLVIGAEQTTLTVRDDGAGFDPAALPAGGATMGMTSMRERVEELDGKFSIESAPGGGTIVRVVAPVGTGEPVGAS